MTFFDTLSNENDVCFVAFDINGNSINSPSCVQTIGLSTTQVPIVQANLSLASAQGCAFNVRITKQNNLQWVGSLNMDRTKSVVQGIAGIATSATTVRTNATSTGTRWGAVGTTSAVTNNSLPQVNPNMLDNAAKTYMRLLSAE